LHRSTKPFISLCFKNVKCDYKDPWISLLDDFYNYAVSLQHSIPSLNVEFILDHLPTSCLQNRWRPWVSTWLYTPVQAFFSNDPSQYYDRYQVMNIPIPPTIDYTITISLLQSFQYGKFLTGNYSYPFLVWEPSDQQIILDVIDVYLSGAPMLLNKHGFRFAINIDPRMFEVYAGSRSTNAWNYAFQGHYYHPKVAAFDNGNMLVLFTNCSTCSTYEYQVFHTDRALGKLSATGSIKSSNLNVKHVTSLKGVRWNENDLVWIGDGSQYTIASLISGEFHVVVHGTVGNGPNTTSTLFASNGTLLAAAVSYTPMCSMSFSVLKISPKAPSTTLMTLCVGNITSFTDPAMDIEQVGSIAYGALFYTTKGQIYGCTFTLDTYTLRTEWSCSAHPVGVGSSPSISIKSFRSEITV
jgi:hypothetical protein